MHIYIAGPMTGYINYNFDAFDRIEEYLTGRGNTVVSPAAIDRLFEGWGKYPPANSLFQRSELIRFIERDLNAIAGCNTIYMMEGWEKSKGANVELSYAKLLGLDVLYEMEAL